jgi:hypothetical protein
VLVVAEELTTMVLAETVETVEAVLVLAVAAEELAVLE